MSVITLSDNESIMLPFIEPSFDYYLKSASEIFFSFDFTNEESCSMGFGRRDGMFPGMSEVRLVLDGGELGDVFHLSPEWNDFFNVSLGKLVNHLCKRGIESVEISCIGASISHQITDSILNACAQHAESIRLVGVPNAPKHLYRFKETFKYFTIFCCPMDEESQIMYGELLETDEDDVSVDCPGETPLTDRGLKAILNGLRTTQKRMIQFRGSSLDQVSLESLTELGQVIVESQRTQVLLLPCPRLGNDRLAAILRPLLLLQRKIRLLLGECRLVSKSAAQLLSRLLMDNKLSALELCGVEDANISFILAPSLESSKLELLVVSKCCLLFMEIVAHALSINPNGIKQMSLGPCTNGHLEDWLEAFADKFNFDRAKVDGLGINVQEGDLSDIEQVYRRIDTIMQRNRCIKKLWVVTPAYADEMNEALKDLVLLLAPTLRSDKVLESLCLGDLRMSPEYEDLIIGLYRDNTSWKEVHRWTWNALTSTPHDLAEFYVGLNKVHRQQIMDPSFPSHIWHEVLAKADKTSMSTLWYCIRSKPEIAQWAFADKDQQSDQPDCKNPTSTGCMADTASEPMML